MTTNVFTSVVKQHWENDVQEQIKKRLLATELCKMVEIPNGTTKNLPYYSRIQAGEYTKYTDVTFSDMVTANDQIVLGNPQMVKFQIDAIDVEDNFINMIPEYTRDASYTLANLIDQDVLAEVLNAKWKYDNNGAGTNTGTLTPVALVTGASQNISTVFGNAKAMLTQSGVDSSRLCLVVDSFTLVAINTLGLEAGFNVSDDAYTKGFRGMFGGMKVYESSNLTSTTTLDLATNPSDGDYVDIQGVRFTFKTTPVLAGAVDIGGTADATAANLILAVNGTGTPGATTYIALSADDRYRMTGITATDGTDLVTFVSNNGDIMATSSMTAAANDFQAQTLNACIMEQGAISLSIRDKAKIEMREENRNLVQNIMIFSRWGLKTTTRGAERMIRIALQSKAAEA